MTDFSLTRRQLLAATGATVASAGCLGNNGSGGGSGSMPIWVDWVPADTVDEQTAGPIGFNVERGLSQASDNSILRGFGIFEILDLYRIDQTNTSYATISSSSVVIVGEFQSDELANQLLEAEAEELETYDGYRILRYNDQQVAFEDGVAIISPDPEQLIDAKAGRITQYGQTGDAAQVLEKMDNAVLQAINAESSEESDIPAANQLRKSGLTINHTNTENRLSASVYYFFESSSAAETAATASDDIIITEFSPEANTFNAEVTNLSQEGKFLISQISIDSQIIEVIA